MKKQRKYLFIAALFFLLIACEKDIDNTIPGNPVEKIEGTQRIEGNLQDFKSIFTSNNTEKGKIWISDALYCPNIHYFGDQLISLPFFIALNPKEKNNINIYVTFFYNEIQSGSPKDEFGLLSNPNQYSIEGNSKLSFSIFRQSILYSLYWRGLCGYDFEIYKYYKHFIHLKTVNEVYQNKEVIFRSYDFNDNVKAFFGACQNLLGFEGYSERDKSYHILSFWQFKHVSFFIKDAKDTILYGPRLLSQVFMIHFPHVIEPCYNKEKKVFAFKVRYHHYYKISILDRYRIQYLIPVSTTEHEMIFSGLGKKLDSEGNPTEEDETYTISFKEILHSDELKQQMPSIKPQYQDKP